MLIRHAEKPTGETGAIGVTEAGSASAGSLTVGGWMRAGALVALFDPAHGEPPPGLSQPTVIWAASPRRDLGQRPQETVIPLAARLGIPVNTRCGKGQETDLAAALLSGQGVALVAWQHEEIPTIVAHLGRITPVPPQQWAADRFDLVWVFTRTTAGWAFSQIPHLLLAGIVRRSLPEDSALFNPTCVAIGVPRPFSLIHHDGDHGDDARLITFLLSPPSPHRRPRYRAIVPGIARHTTRNAGGDGDGYAAHRARIGCGEGWRDTMEAHITENNRWTPDKGAPTDHLIACFVDAVAAEVALGLLRADRFADDDLLALDGHEAYEGMRRAEERNPLRRFSLMLENASATEADTGRAGYLKALQRGHTVVYVYTPDEERKASAYHIVQAAHGHKISHRGRWITTQLP